MPQSSVLSPYCKFPKLGKYIHTSSQIWILEVVILLNLESRKERKYLKWHVFSMSCELTLFLNARHGLMQSRWPGDIILSLFQMLISRILKGVYLVSILPFHIYPFSVLTSCCSRRRSWSRNTFTFSKFDFYLDFDEIACNAHDLWWWWLLLLLLLSTRLWKVKRQPSGNTRGTVKSLAPRSRNSERRWPSTKVILYWIDNILISAFHFEKRVASSSPATALDPVSVQWIAFDFQ